MMRGWRACVGDFLLVRTDDIVEKFYIGRVQHMTNTHYCLQWWVREHHSASPLHSAYLPQKNHVNCRRASLEQLPFDAQCIQDILKMVRGAGGEGRRCISRQGMIRVNYWEGQWKKAPDSDPDDDVSLATLRDRDQNSDSDPDDNVPLDELMRARQGAPGADPGVKEESQENDMQMGGDVLDVREFDCALQTLARCQIFTWGRRGKGRTVTLKLEEGEYIETFVNIEGNKLLSYKSCVRGGQRASGSK